MKPSLTTRSLAMGGLALLASAAACAESPSPSEEKFTVFTGAFLPAFNTDVRVNNEADEGNDVNLGDDLGVDQDQTGFWVGLDWRIAERHGLGMTYSSFTQKGQRVIDREIAIGDEIYPVDATIFTQYQIDLIPITYSYSLLKREKDELAVTAGIHWNSITLTLSGSSSLSSDDVTTTASASADLPLPLFGLSYEHRFSDRWSAGVGASFFSIEFGEDTLDAKGSLLSARAFGEYRLSKMFGVGLAVDAFRLDLDVAKTRWNGGLEYDYWGPQLYVTARF